jgi:hypothetical protein
MTVDEVLKLGLMVHICLFGDELRCPLRKESLLFTCYHGI